jgi:type II secretory pathway pseudopilin PulG
MNHNYKFRSGVTLIELLVASVVIIILGGAVLGLQYIVSQSQTSVWKSYLGVEDANAVVSSINRELRNARAGDDGSYVLAAADDQQIIFYSDYDFDGVTERIRYTLTGSDLVKGIIEPTTPPVTYPLGSEIVKTLTPYVRSGSSPIFYYYNGDWPQDTTNNPLPSADRISDTRLIRISLTINTHAQEPKTNYLLESYVQIRVLKDN